MFAALSRLGPDALRQLRQMEPDYVGFKRINEDGYVVHQRTVVPPEPVALVALVQLRAADIADLSCPAGTDLLQVLWCPNQHRDDDHTGHVVHLRWRATADLADLVDPDLVDAAEPPAPATWEESYLPRACDLHPEEVTEYPWWEELPPELGRRIRDWDDGRGPHEDTYFSTSQAPGWKVGGYAEWDVTDLQEMTCAGCGRTMDLLLTIDSTESGDGAWQPEQERHLTPSFADPRWQDVNEPTGISVGRHGQLRIFICRTCPGTPHRLNLQ
ncbi:MAG TPA: hypothetical protein VFT95_08060 [Micromonosporaceae bacterium]|nr:hypothetical protein [Micromonosporaceae bacterium]